MSSFLEESDLTSVKRKMKELSSVIKTKHEHLEKVQKSNKWSSYNWCYFNFDFWYSILKINLPTTNSSKYQPTLTITQISPTTRALAKLKKK
jgi:hypothetical protein